MKTATYDQIKDFAIRVLNLKKDGIDGEAMDNGLRGRSKEEIDRQIIAFLNNGLSFVMKGPGALLIDRTKPFDPAKFIGGGWTIWRGAKDGDGLEGDEQQDARSLALTEVDFAQVLFTACLNEGETVITGEEKLKRHSAAGHIRFDAKIGQTLYEEKSQATLEWLYQTFGITWFEMPGTELRDSSGDRCFLCLCRDGYGRWDWGYYWLGYDRSVEDPSAVLGK